MAAIGGRSARYLTVKRIPRVRDGDVVGTAISPAKARPRFTRSYSWSTRYPISRLTGSPIPPSSPPYKRTNDGRTRSSSLSPAQELDTLEKEGILVNRTVERLARVDRALAKIDAGTYGFSDVSGERIPEARLNAMPEAVNTLREQEDSEHKT
jgi:RNA polymerase-binding transcription factor DksA